MKISRKLSLGLSMLLLAIAASTAQANPTFISVQATLEQVRVEVFYNEDTNEGQLYATNPLCKTCSPDILAFDNTVVATHNGKAVSFSDLLQWKNVIVDVHYDDNSKQAQNVTRYER